MSENEGFGLKKNVDSEQDLTHGNILKELWSIAWPMMISFFFYTVYNLIDAYWVSKISADAIAAVSISQLTLFIMISLGFGITVGSGVIMAMNIGAKNIKEAERTLGQSFVLSAILGVFFTIIALVFRNQLLTLSGAGGAIFNPALRFYTIMAAGSVLLFIMSSIIFAFNSEGDTKTLTKLFFVSIIINCILDPLLILGWLGVPSFGIAGAAIATLFSQAVFIILSIIKLSSKKRVVRFHFSNLNVRWESAKKVLKIGFPAALTQVIFPLGLTALTYVVSKGFSDAGTIAFTLGLRVEFFAYLPAIGFGFAAMALMGQNFGAGNANRAKEAFRKALKYAFFGATGIGILAAIFSRQIIGVFTTDPLVAKYAASYLYSVALSYGFLAALMVEANSFQALGRSWPGFWMFFFMMSVSVFLSYTLTKILGLPIEAVWISIITSNVATAALGFFWIRKVLKRVDISKMPVHHIPN